MLEMNNEKAPKLTFFSDVLVILHMRENRYTTPTMNRLCVIKDY